MSLRLPIAPEILGFDPRLQFTHEDDVTGAMVFSTLNDVPGIFNVAGDGTTTATVLAEAVLRKSGHTLLDCPVSGTGSQARTGDLVIYASGDTKAIARLKPMFAGYSRKTYDVGTFGNGSKMKYVANLLVAINNVASAEAMVLGMKSGLDPKTIFEMIQSGAGNSRVFELRAPMMVKNDYASDVTMKCSVWQKDMDVIGGYAKKLKVPTPLFSATQPNLVPGRSNNPVLGDPNRYFDPSAFVVPAPGSLGNVGRNTVTTPGTNNIDFTVVKTTAIRENMKLEFRAEFFNILNHTQLGLPGRTKTGMPILVLIATALACGAD